MVLIGKGRLGETDRLQMRATNSALHEYYTNFDAKDLEAKYEVKTAHKRHLTPEESTAGWWKFKTNLELDDFDFGMSEAQVKSFLRRMWEIYRYRKVE